MAKSSNITTSNRVPPYRIGAEDAASRALKRMISAGDNDKQYGRARADLFQAKATTIEGVAAKIEAFRAEVYPEGEFDGEGFMAVGAELMHEIHRAINDLMLAPRHDGELYFE